MQKGLLSVIIPTYKRNVEMLARAVCSVINQTYNPIEIIVVDDNQMDSTYSNEVKDYCEAEEGVEYIRQDGNKGACAARNLGVKMSEGEYLGFLDDDDTWEYNKAELQIKEFKDNVGLVFCKGTTIDENFDPPHKTIYFNEKHFKKKVNFQDLLTMDCIGSTSQVIILRKCFEESGGFDENIPARQDYEMWIRVSKKYEIKGIDKYLFNYYIHKGEQITKSSVKSLQGYKTIYRIHSDDYKKNKAAKKFIIQKIITASRESKHYCTFLKYSVYLMILDPVLFTKLTIQRLREWLFC